MERMEILLPTMRGSRKSAVNHIIARRFSPTRALDHHETPLTTVSSRCDVYALHTSNRCNITHLFDQPYIYHVINILVEIPVHVETMTKCIESS